MKSVSNTENQIVVRRLQFNLGASHPKKWYEGDLYKSHFFNALSILFPIGEKYFIDAVRANKDKVKDKKLLKEVNAFIGQEGNHTRVHIDYNKNLEKYGYAVERMEKRLQWWVDFSNRYNSKLTQLAYVLASEHFTALFAEVYLKHPEWQKNSNEQYKGMWRWHALEELEHKSVAFDVYQASGGGYFRRVTTMALLTPMFFYDVTYNLFSLLRKDKQLWNPVVWAKGHNFLWIYPGILTRCIPAYLKYFLPGFHPAKHNNKKLIDQIKKEYESYELNSVDIV